jgi:hypothetical protein
MPIVGLSFRYDPAAPVRGVARFYTRGPGIP